MLNDKMIKSKLSRIKKLHNIEIDKKNIHIHSSDYTGYIGISKNAVYDIIETKPTINIRAKPAFAVISLWKKTPYTHISLFRLMGKVV